VQIWRSQAVVPSNPKSPARSSSWRINWCLWITTCQRPMSIWWQNWTYSDVSWQRLRSRRPSSRSNQTSGTKHLQNLIPRPQEGIGHHIKGTLNLIYKVLLLLKKKSRTK
jgi:hypothetical protein